MYKMTDSFLVFNTNFAQYIWLCDKKALILPQILRRYKGVNVAGMII